MAIIDIEDIIEDLYKKFNIAREDGLHALCHEGLKKLMLELNRGEDVYMKFGESDSISIFYPRNKILAEQNLASNILKRKSRERKRLERERAKNRRDTINANRRSRYKLQIKAKNGR